MKSTPGSHYMPAEVCWDSAVSSLHSGVQAEGTTPVLDTTDLSYGSHGRKKIPLKLLLRGGTSHFALILLTQVSHMGKPDANGAGMCSSP